MRKATSVLCLAVLMLAACGEETRDGMLTLAGVAPLTIVDQSGKAVEFAAGPTKVVFSADKARKFTVTVSQGQDKTATFSGQTPSSQGWNFTLLGKDIGQKVDLTSSHKVEYFGRPWRTIREGMPCGYNGRWLVEEEYQSCSEDWSVAFADSASAQPVGTFASRRGNMTCFLGSHNLYCRDFGPNPPYPHYPHPPRRLQSAEDSVKKLEALGVGGIKFD